MSPRRLNEARNLRMLTSLALLGLCWHFIEAGAGFYLGAQLDSPTLRGFALDSGVEIMAGAVLLFQLLGLAVSERRSSRIIGISFFLIALWVGFDALSSFVSPAADPSSAAQIWALALAGFVVLTMYPLAFYKQKIASSLHSDAAVSEGRQTMLCGHMAWIVVLGVVGPMVGLPFLDGLAAILISLIACREGAAAMRGKACACSLHPRGVDYSGLRKLSFAWVERLSPGARALFSLRWPLTAAFLALGAICSSGGLWLVTWGLCLIGISSLWLPLWVIRSRTEEEMIRSYAG